MNKFGANRVVERLTVNDVRLALSHLSEGARLAADKLGNVAVVDENGHRLGHIDFLHSREFVPASVRSRH